VLRRRVHRLRRIRIQEELIEEALEGIGVARVDRGPIRCRICRRARRRDLAHAHRRSRSRFGILRILLR
jgi:hypothetical protein